MCATSDDLARGDSDAVDHLILHKEPGQSLKDLNVYGYQVRQTKIFFSRKAFGFLNDYDLHDYCIALSLFFFIIFVFI